MPKEDSKAFEQAMEGLNKLSPSEMQARIKELDRCASVECVPVTWELEKRSLRSV